METTAMATMSKEAREAILKNVLARSVTKAKGKFCKFDCNIGGSIIVGRLVDGNCYFWIEGDSSTYEIKGKRFFNVSGTEIRKGETISAKEEIKEVTEKPIKESGIMKTASKKRAANKAKEVDKIVVIPKGGEMYKQLGYDGKEEEVPATLYTNKIKCACGNVRWVKNADLFQVKKCKPCMKKGRLQKINELKKSKSAKAPKTKNGYPVKA